MYKMIEHLQYLIELEKLSQSVTVINAENRVGKNLYKQLKKAFRGEIDGYNTGATFIGLLALGEYSIKLQPNENNEFYISYYCYQKNQGISCNISGLAIYDYLIGIGAVKSKQGNK